MSICGLIFLLPYVLIGCCLGCYRCHLLELFELNVILIEFACEAYVFFGVDDLVKRNDKLVS